MRQSAEVLLEVADHAVDAQAGVFADQPHRRLAHRRLGEVDRHVERLAACSPSSGRSRCSVFSEDPEPSSTSAVAPGRVDDLRAARRRGSTPRCASGSTRAAHRSGRTAPSRWRRRSTSAAAARGLAHQTPADVVGERRDPLLAAVDVEPHVGLDRGELELFDRACSCDRDSSVRSSRVGSRRRSAALRAGPSCGSGCRRCGRGSPTILHAAPGSRRRRTARSTRS